MRKVYVIVGAGFRGFCDAIQLLKRPGAKVYMIDRDPFFGGIGYSGSHGHFAVDKGVHMFDSIPQDLAEIVAEIMDGRVRTIDFVSASAFNGKVTQGFSLPDLQSLPAETKEQITHELRELAGRASQPVAARTLLELFEARYGKTAGAVFAEIFRHVYNLDAAQAQPDAISRTSLGRLKYLDDADMVAMKASDPFLDSVLAARRKAAGIVDGLVSIYPDTGEAMRGWCIRAQKWLEARGVVMCLGETPASLEQAGSKVRVRTDRQVIEADKVIWTNDNTQALASLLGFDFDTRSFISGTPMLFATLVTQARHIKNFTYLQNFDREGTAFRIASAGIYSNQIDAQANSFITCECPAPMDSERWANFDQSHSAVWQECKDLGVVSADAQLVSHSVQRVPVTFKISRLGYDQKIEEFGCELATRSPNVVFRDVKPFFRRDIYLDSLKVNELVAA